MIHAEERGAGWRAGGALRPLGNGGGSASPFPPPPAPAQGSEPEEAQEQDPEDASHPQMRTPFS